MPETGFLTPTVILLSAGFCAILLCRFMRISPIIGFLVAGVLLGPHGLQYIENTETTKLLAKLGVVFFLFDIGLHFSLKSAWKLRKDLFVLAPLQVLTTGIILAFSLNIIFDIRGDFALLAGFALALSSTAVVMQMLGDFKRIEGPVGQSTKSILIFQDIGAVFLFIFADAVGSGESLPPLILSAIGKTILATFAAIILGRYILSPLMRLITKYDDPEMFTVLGLAIVMVTALATDSVGLSLTLGAFLAGMVLAETPFRALLQAELRPFRSLLVAFFFITIGMQVSPHILWQDIGIITGIVILIISIKAAIMLALTFILNRPAHHAIQLSFFLAQGGEFALVILSMVSVQIGLGDFLVAHLITAIAVSMLLTPLVSAIAYRWSLELCRTMDGITNYTTTAAADLAARQPVFIVGMNDIGQTLARALDAHDIPYIAVENNRARFMEATANGYIVIYGHPNSLQFWSTLGVNTARALCMTTPDLETAQDLSPIMNKLYPHVKRFVGVRDSIDGVRFAALGLKPINSMGAPAGLDMACIILCDLGIAQERADIWRKEEYAAFLENQTENPVGFSAGNEPDDASNRAA